MNITSVNLEIINLLNARCLVTVATLLWCTRLRIGKSRLVLPLLASLTKQGTLSLCFFLLYLSNFKRSSQKFDCSSGLRLFSRIWRKYFGSGSCVESKGENALGDTFPILSSWMASFTKDLSFSDQQTPCFTSIRS